MNGVDAKADRHESGTTLVELLIALAVMSIAMVVISSTLIMVLRATDRVEHSSEAIDAARLVSATLDRELRSAVCISLPLEGKPGGNTLTFQTLSSSGPVITYQIKDEAGVKTVTRTENGQERTVIDGVGSTTTAFQQMMTPLRTVVVNIPIRSANGGEFNLQTTVAGRNAWHRCEPKV